MINAILAIDTNYGIGKNNGLPWAHSDADMKWFRDNTRDGVVVMGRKTWNSIGNKPLKGRINCILSSDADTINTEITKTIDPSQRVMSFDIQSGMHSFLKNLEVLHPDKTIWIIGGADIYRQALPYCKNIYLTKFKREYECDTFLDRSLFKDFMKLAHSENTTECSFSIWSRI